MLPSIQFHLSVAPFIRAIPCVLTVRLAQMDPSGRSSCISSYNDGPHDHDHPAAVECKTVQTTTASPLPAHLRGWRRAVRNFTPSWFSATMGTGIVSILLHNLPYNGAWLYWLSVVLFCVNILLFAAFFIISLLRYTLYPVIWGKMIRHPQQSLFIGTIPMGFATIVNMVVFVCVPAWGQSAAILVRDRSIFVSATSHRRDLHRLSRLGSYGGLTWS